MLMPLYYINGGDLQVAASVPHDSENRPLISNIPPQELAAIIDELNRRIDEVVDSPTELITAGWIPGNDWTGTIWEPIFTACRYNFDRSGMVFGALVFEVMMNRPEDWSLGKYQVNGRDIGSNTYFRIFPKGNKAAKA
jgi:hypothetical protein